MENIFERLTKMENMKDNTKERKKETKKQKVYAMRMSWAVHRTLKRYCSFSGVSINKLLNESLIAVVSKDPLWVELYDDIVRDGKNVNSALVARMDTFDDDVESSPIPEHIQKIIDDKTRRS